MVEQLEGGLRSILLGDGDIPESIGDRIRPDALSEEDTFPAIVIDVRDINEEGAIDEDGGTRFCTATVYVVAISQSKKESKSISSWIRRVLNEFEGIAGGIDIQSCESARRTHHFVPRNEVIDVDFYETQVVFDIQYEE